VHHLPGNLGPYTSVVLHSHQIGIGGFSPIPKFARVSLLFFFSFLDHFFLATEKRCSTGVTTGGSYFVVTSDVAGPCFDIFLEYYSSVASHGQADLGRAITQICINCRLLVEIYTKYAFSR
jgi:hypothetical protein